MGIFKIAGGTITANHLILQNGKAENGGALNILGGGYIANGGAFLNNTATKYGGAIYVDASGSFTTNELACVDTSVDPDAVEFTGNAAQRGGAIWNKGDVEINGAASFKNNAATTGSGATNGSFGGAIYNAGTGKVAIDSCDATNPVVFQNNQATGTTIVAPNGVLKGYSGGAIYNAGSGEVNVTNAKFSGNFAGKYGGAISNFATLTATNATFTSNVASAGGAVQSSGDATFTNTTFTSNKALAVKGGYSLDGELDFGGNGGAVFASGSGKSVTFNDATAFSDNEAANAGGAIDFINGSLKLDGSGTIAVTGNKAGTIGGGLVLASNLTVGKSLSFSVADNSLAAVGASDAFHKAGVTGDFAKATDVAAIAAVGAEKLQKIFNATDLSALETAGNFYTFVRYSQLTSNILCYNDLAHYYEEDGQNPPNKIAVSVDGGETLYLWKESMVAIDLTNGANKRSFEVKYWAASQTGATPNTAF
ncbi:MAG: hypothetical protein J6X44_09095, partial [Thermoguttaceae bacterium]|nr:hypothetical protein [Thermoguttaceae bacterium]